MDYPKDYREFLKANSWDERAKCGPESDESKGLPRPAVQKPYPEGSKLIDLVPPEDITVGDTPLRQVIGQRMSRRSYKPNPLSLEELSFLLWATQGVTYVNRQGDRVLTRRTVPSGGGHHTFETYLIINHVAGVKPGLYRYLPLDHKLLFLRSDPGFKKKVVDGCRGQEFVAGGAVIFIWTTTPHRMEWRYTIVTPKVIAQDSGHLCQNLYLASEAIGCGTCAIGAYDQKKLDELVEVDGEDEFVIYAAPVGKVG